MQYAPLVHQHRRAVAHTGSSPAVAHSVPLTRELLAAHNVVNRPPDVGTRGGEIRAMQRVAGNHAVQSLLRRPSALPPAEPVPAPGVCPLCGRIGWGKCSCGRQFLSLTGRQGDGPSPSSVSKAPGLLRSGRVAESSRPEGSAGATFPSAAEWFSDPLLEAIRFSATGSNSALLARGATGPSVALVQRALRAWGFASLTPPRDLLPGAGADGDYGNETAAAVEVLQKRAGVDPDGMLGPVTLGFLDTQIPGNAGASAVDLSADDHLVGPAVPGRRRGRGCPNGGFVNCSDLGDDSRPVLVTSRIETARGFVRQALDDLPAPSDVSTPAGRAFADLFGTPGADNVPRVRTRIEQVAQVLAAARLREVDPSAVPVVVCARDCHRTCQLPATAFHSAADGSIGLCGGFFREDLLPAIAALLHEVTHAALQGETDIYSDARLFDLLATIDVTENGVTSSAGENNTDSIVAYVLRANGAAKGDSTTRGAPPPDLLAFPESERAHEEEARAALAFAEQWILGARTAASRVRIALDGLTGAIWPADARLTGTRNLVHLLRQFNAFGGATPDALNDPANCQDATRFDFSCPAIGAATSLAQDRAEARRIVTVYDDRFRLPLEQPFRVFPVGPKPGGAAVDWVLDQRMLALFERFFLLADRTARTRELLLALAREQGVGIGDGVAFVSFAQELFEHQFPAF